MRKLKLAALAVVAGLALAACGGSAPQGTTGGGDEEQEQGGTITIGAVHPLTGPLAYDGQQMADAVKLAVDHINDDGGIRALGGATLEVAQADSQGQPEVGQSEAQRLIQEGAVGIVGPYQSAVASNVAAVAERNQVPFVIDVAVADAILQQGYQYTFRIQPNASAMGTQGARYLKEVADATGTPVRTVGYLHEQTDYGTSVYKAFKAEAEKLGMQVPVEVTYDAQAASDLTTEVTRIKAAGVDVLAVTGYYRDGVLAAKNIAAVKPGVQAVLGVANGAFDLTQFATDTGAAGEGFLNANYRFDATNPDTRTVMEAFKSEHGDEMRTAAVLSYDAVRALAQALEEAGSRDPKAVRDALAELSMDSLLAFAGPVEFDDTGQNTNATPVMTQVQGGRIATVHPADLAEAEPKFPAPPAGG